MAGTGATRKTEKAGWWLWVVAVVTVIPAIVLGVLATYRHDPMLAASLALIGVALFVFIVSGMFYRRGQTAREEVVLRMVKAACDKMGVDTDQATGNVRKLPNRRAS